MKKKLMALLVTAVMIGSCFTALANRGGFFEAVAVYYKDLNCAGYWDTNNHLVEGSAALVDGNHLGLVVDFYRCKIMITGMEGGEYMDSISEEGLPCAIIESTPYNPNITTGFWFRYFTLLVGEQYYTQRYERTL